MIEFLSYSFLLLILSKQGPKIKCRDMTPSVVARIDNLNQIFFSLILLLFGLFHLLLESGDHSLVKLFDLVTFAGQDLAL